MHVDASRPRQKLGEEHHGGSTQTVAGASVVVGRAAFDAALEVDGASSFVCDGPHSERDTGSVKRDNLQRADQTESIVITNDSEEALCSLLGLAQDNKDP